MKRRIGIGAITGLGGGGPSLIDSDKVVVSKKMIRMYKRCSKDAYDTFFKGTAMDENYVDAGVKGHEFRVGIEPSYMYEELKMIVISKQKDLSYYMTGIAYGGYGTGIRSKVRFYKDFKYKSKFIKFVNKWHPYLWS